MVRTRYIGISRTKVKMLIDARAQPVVVGFREDTVSRFGIERPVWRWWEKLAKKLIPIVES